MPIDTSRDDLLVQRLSELDEAGNKHPGMYLNTITDHYFGKELGEEFHKPITNWRDVDPNDLQEALFRAATIFPYIRHSNREDTQRWLEDKARQVGLEERLTQIEQYVLDQPWRRRPNLPIPLLIDDIDLPLRRISTIAAMVPGEHRRVSSKQWRDISEEWESRDPTTEVPLAKRIIDLYGDTIESFLDSYPIPDNLHQAEQVEHILKSLRRLEYPGIEEEGVISKQYDLVRGHPVLVFEDGSTMQNRIAYEPSLTKHTLSLIHI